MAASTSHRSAYGVLGLEHDATKEEVRCDALQCASFPHAEFWRLFDVVAR